MVITQWEIGLITHDMKPTAAPLEFRGSLHQAI